ncbi:MAG: methyltransferase [Oscillospiraceae bacterium]|nr:methyltransferase [Oscillospiraceae bacterium]
MLNILTSDAHKYGTDSVLLAEFADTADLKNKIVVDLCSGCGIIPVMLNRAKAVFAVEIQDTAAELIRANAELYPQIKLIHGDLRCEDSLKQIGQEAVDLVTANPPYYKLGSGFERADAAHKTARYEGGCSLEDVVKAAAVLLKFGGKLKMCMTAPRLAETIAVMQKFAIEPKEITLISAKNSDTARLFLISGKKGAKPGVIVKWR